MSRNIFADEWRACLRAHYLHVVRTGDHVTEPSLRLVMLEAGFGDDELAELRVRATLHVDAVGADFVPDLAILRAVPAAPPEPPPPEAESPAEERAPDDNLAPPAEPAPPEADAGDADAPQQLSLF